MTSTVIYGIILINKGKLLIKIMYQFIPSFFALFFLVVSLFLKNSYFPEKYYPIKYDIWLNSHTIFHLGIVISVVFF